MKSLRNGTHYVGLTNNVNRRLSEHNQGKNQSTKSNIPWMLTHVEVVSNRKDARLMEKYFKSGYGREIVKEIESNLTS